MTDYTKATGSSGTMMIRDTGTYVEFWIKAGSSTFTHDMPWGYTINGVTDTSNSFDFASGGAYQRVGRWNVTTDQTVTFYLYDTGTSGLGGPTTFSVAIDRSSIPNPPSAPVISSLTTTSLIASFTDGSNNGLAIDSRQIGYSRSSSAPTTIISSDGSTSVAGLLPGTLYYFWARTHNAKGYSGWSARTAVTMHNYPAPPTAPVITLVTQSSVHSRFTGNSDGGSPILEWQTGYGTHPTIVQTFVSGYNLDLTNLSPGEVYYFWGRGRNKYGWGNWSARSTATLLAGAWVDVAGVKKRAVPYVNVNGVWKVVQPYVKIAGMWKETG